MAAGDQVLRVFVSSTLGELEAERPAARAVTVAALAWISPDPDAWRARTDAVPAVERNRPDAAAGVGLADDLEGRRLAYSAAGILCLPAPGGEEHADGCSDERGHRKAVTRTRGLSLVTWATLGCTR